MVTLLSCTTDDCGQCWNCKDNKDIADDKAEEEAKRIAAENHAKNDTSDDDEEQGGNEVASRVEYDNEEVAAMGADTSESWRHHDFDGHHEPVIMPLIR